MKILGRVVSGYSGFQELDAEGVEAWAWGLGVGLCILGIFHGDTSGLLAIMTRCPSSTLLPLLVWCPPINTEP